MSSIPGPSVGYIDLLNFATEEASKEAVASGSDFEKTPFRPSAAGKCTRELFYEGMVFHKKAKYEVAHKAPEVSRLLGLGHSIEYHIIKQFEQYLDAFEVKYKQQVLDFGPLGDVSSALYQRLEGSLDCCFISKQWKCVVDFKSKKDKFSKYRETKWDEELDKLSNMRSVKPISEAAFWVENLEAFLTELRDPFFEANFLQLNLYANSGFLKERGIDHGAIIRYCKNDSRLMEIRFRPCAKVAERVLGKFRTAVAAVEVGAPPPRDYTLGSMKCAFCPYARECHDENSLKAWFKTFPARKWPDDTSKLGEVGEQLEFAFAAREPRAAATDELKAADEAILKLMVDNELTKIRLANGDVYEARHLKSPRPHFELKRSKA